MSELPDDLELAYVSKATFLHLWEKFKQTEQALAQSDSINQSLASNAVRLGNECRDQADQVKVLKTQLNDSTDIIKCIQVENDDLKVELARVMEDLHTTNDVLASLRLDHKWLTTCHKTQASTYHQHILSIAGAVQGIADAGEYNPKEAKLWADYEKAMGEASEAFKQ